ncbi:pentapeptide repeat-containing protein [Streptomyces cylindrosporus]|uniref:Pentapeptide repeat-containing protein n=1 Tax=Streptomyces cylindrosporus TaxID=2927583 RepID=A0ABS9YG91_9ACTN|nr:pentapeptide repeat-containing protein [Streptomyces cylindrosporus]MCI3276267.1 pentapeptide repeat-containing protein [Streptomyces cylindrosporus]
MDGLDTGDPVDFRGVEFTASLTEELQQAIVRCSAFGEALFTRCHFLAPIDFKRFGFQGATWFDDASFESADFTHAVFHESACFLRATFNSSVTFQSATLGKAANLSRARFKGEANFSTLERWPSLNFDECIFEDFATFEMSNLDNASFSKTQFQATRFRGAAFINQPYFRNANFSDLANFEGVNFAKGANFRYSKFPNGGIFAETIFDGLAMFSGARFGKLSVFTGVKFQNEADFSGAVCQGGISFKGSQFADLFHGPISARDVNLGYAHFERSVRFEVSTRNLVLARATFLAAATFSVRFAKVFLTDVHLSSPLTISSHRHQFTLGDQVVPDPEAGDLNPLSKVFQLAGVNAALLVLNDVDVSQCSFSGAYHLDQITLEGECRFATPPRGIQWGRSIVPLRRWSPRKTLRDEIYWRSRRSTKDLERKGWDAGDGNTDEPPSAQNVAAIYRQIRKAFEDGSNEPGAADFYYGEMEMRRRSENVSRSERGLLHAYWALSGFGLRASRAVTWLLIAMTVTIVLMMGWGLPDHLAKQTATGVISSPGSETTLMIEVPKQHLYLPFDERWTLSRLERSGRVVVNSVIFRSSGQGLTAPGIWIEMISRFTEPILLGLAILAIRGRVKRS